MFNLCFDSTSKLHGTSTASKFTLEEFAGAENIIKWKQEPVLRQVSSEVILIHIETTFKKPCGKFVDISSDLKDESTSSYPCRIDVIISTLICLSELMIH